MKYWFVTALFLTACTPEIDVGVTFGIEDSCLTMFPECEGTGYFCVDEHGFNQPQCRVGCFAGRAIMCAEDGPHCLQEFDGLIDEVPVFCTVRE